MARLPRCSFLIIIEALFIFIGFFSSRLWLPREPIKEELMSEKVRLTELAFCAGCAAKLRAEVLTDVKIGRAHV